MAAVTSLVPPQYLSDALEVRVVGRDAKADRFRWMDRPATATEPLRNHMTMSLRAILAEQAAGCISNASMAAADVGAAVAAAQVCSSCP